MNEPTETEGPQLPPTGWMVALAKAERTPLPEHVRAAYRWNQLRDAFLDGLGRVWYAGTVTLRERLPGDPMSCKTTIPPEFWHPSVARQVSRAQQAAAKDAMDYERAERETRRFDPTLELVP